MAGLLGGLAAIASGALQNFISALGEKLIDPSINEALSPSAGLTVGSLYFQSVEQEGRWKLPASAGPDWGYNPERILSGPQFADVTQSPVPNPVNSALNGIQQFARQPAQPMTQLGGKFYKNNVTILTIDIGPPTKIEQVLSALLAGPLAGVLPLAKETILQPAHAEIDATWITDGLEIWGGYAGLALGTGFESVYGHRAKVDIGGTVLGNYLPASYLIGLSGYVNPVGPMFIEFRCGIVISSKHSPVPMYGTWWNRDTKQVNQLRYSEEEGKGFSLNFPEPFENPK